MEHDCNKCIYYNEKENMCDGYTYRCDCLDNFCPMYESEEMIEFRKTTENRCKILKQEDYY